MNSFLKRFFDLVVSFFGLFFLWWLILIAFIVATCNTKSNGFFIQKRVGRDEKLFSIIKIKTMKKVAGVDVTITASNDIRITKSGAFFRKTKIDELPQLWNILIGQMSFVGPRPDVPGYADRLQGKDRRILSIRPGITGPAQLAYRDEEDILDAQNDPVKYNDEVIWPDKVKINLEYVASNTIFKDFYYIWKTIVGGNVKN